MTRKRILWVVGQQQAGKTTYASIYKMYGVRVLNIGELLRAKNSIQSFVESENPYAPQFVESEVQTMIKSQIAVFLDDALETLLVIDSAPRNPEQYAILENVREISEIVIIKQSFSTRQSRAILKYNGDLTYFHSREKHEKEWLDFLKLRCELNEIPLIEIGGI